MQSIIVSLYGLMKTPKRFARARMGRSPIPQLFKPTNSTTTSGNATRAIAARTPNIGPI
ncbi:hypothetical protein [Leptolyngbya sp. FACHB-671]|uniref:hypothetical protein n=1 Tax=Leptolyngbya sp. FACHB-671 TaxID=2692812 RepID=UPI001A7E6BFC|nr:hypothetical protein [Leptolyngbya sp. FACHB-671]